MAPKFNLQNVLDVRHSRVEALEVELAKLVALRQKIQEYLDALNLERADKMAHLEQAQMGELDLFEISILRANILSLDARIARAENDRDRIETALNAKRREMVAAKQDEETLQILKRKREDEFKQAVVLQENKTQDDIYIAQGFRRRLAHI